MLAEVDVLARLAAWTRRRAVLIRETAAIAPDPERVFALTIIQLLGEARIQAVAYGYVGDEPSVSVSTNPLNRTVSYLEPFAVALTEYVRDMLQGGLLPRVWIADTITLQCLRLLSARYRNNRSASEIVRALGRLCAALTSDAEYEGAQVIVSALDLLHDHLRSGQTPLEDTRLASLLAWIDPLPGVDPWIEAERRAAEPSAAMLSWDDDIRVEQQRDAVRRARATATRLRARADLMDTGDEELGESVIAERLRARALDRDDRADDAEGEMTRILTRSVREAYDLLLEARTAYWALPLRTCPGIEQLVGASLQRLTSALSSSTRPATEPHTLAIELEAREHAVALTESVYMGGDSLIREQARLQGRAFRAILVDVRQPKSNRKPCLLVVLTQQTVLRVRAGTQLRILGTPLVGRVTTVAEDGDSQGTRIEIELTAGFRSVPAIGEQIDADDAVLFGAAERSRRIYTQMARARSALVYGTLPAPQPRNLPSDEGLLEIARRLRRN